MRLNEAKTALKDLLSHNQVSGKPVLLLANKQDQSEALDEIDLVEQLDLEHLVNENRCPTLVETCSAIEAKGLKKGYNWLVSYIIRNYESLNARIANDSKKDEAESKTQQQLNGHVIHVRSAVATPNHKSRPKSAPTRHFRVIDEPRPKSANQIVMDHLRKKSGHEPRRSRLRPLPANKTHPAVLFQGNVVEFVGGGDAAGNQCLNARHQVQRKGGGDVLIVKPFGVTAN